MKIWKRAIIFIILVAVGFMFYIQSWEPHVAIDMQSDIATSINLFYDNGMVGEYRFDDTHMSEAVPLSAGRQTVFIPVPKEGMNRIRLDFGTSPGTMTLFYITVQPTLFEEYYFDSSDIFNWFEVQNDIINSEEKDGAVVYTVTGTDGFIAADTDLTQAATARISLKTVTTLAAMVALACALTWIDILARGFAKIFRKLYQLGHDLCVYVHIPNDYKRAVLGVGVCAVSAACIALVIDGVLLKILYRAAVFLGMDTMTRYFSAGSSFSLLRAGFFFILIFVGMLCLLLGGERTVRYRYLLATLLLVLMTCGEYTGSSLGFYDGMLLGNTEEYQCSTLLGIPQGIRGDEWATEKPYYFAQVNGGDDLPYYNDKLMMDGADMIVSAFSPVKDPIILFRPSLLGFLFLPAANAFAFYWWWKIIALFMSAFELCRILTGRNRYGFYGAMIFTFAPAIRWWLSQSTTELYTFGFFAVACYYAYFQAERRVLRGLSIVGVFYFLTCYILTIYPACQVPVAYVLLGVVIWIIWRNWDKHPFAPRRLCTYVLVALPFAGLLVRFWLMSGPAIQTMLDTVYPGATRAWISLPAEYPLYQLINPFTAFIRNPDFSNSCEISQFYSFGIITVPLIIWLIVRRQKKVLLPALLCGISTLLALIAWLPEMPIINQITLLSMSYPSRIMLACGIGYTLTLISLVPMLEEEIQGICARKALVICGALWLFLLSVGSNCENVFSYFCAVRFGTVFFVCIVTLLCYMAYLLLRGGRRSCTYFMSLLVALNVFSTVWIDPITCGTDSMFEKTTMQAIRQLNAEDPGRWMVSGSPTISNLVSAQGVARVSGTYFYPDWTMMEIIDPNHEYEHYWNQYAHIDMRLTDGDMHIDIIEEEISEKVQGLTRIIYIDLETAKKLGIKYIFSAVDVPEDMIASGQVKVVYKDLVDSWKIYKIAE